MDNNVCPVAIVIYVPIDTHGMIVNKAFCDISYGMTNVSMILLLIQYHDIIILCINYDVLVPNWLVHLHVYYYCDIHVRTV